MTEWGQTSKQLCTQPQELTKYDGVCPCPVSDECGHDRLSMELPGLQNRTKLIERKREQNRLERQRDCPMAEYGQSWRITKLVMGDPHQ